HTAVGASSGWEWSLYPIHPTGLSVPSAIGANSADSVGILSVSDIITPLPTVCTTTWRITDTLTCDCQHSHLAPAFIDGSFSVPITCHTAVGIDDQSVPTLSFVSTTAEAAAAWNLLSDEDEDNVVVPANALPTNKAITNPSLSTAVQVAKLQLQDSSTETSSASPNTLFILGLLTLQLPGPYCLMKISLPIWPVLTQFH
ncbi:hypothetical protein CVT25_005403, partial [Psilocybe cyanescens]